jgi:hypothetical protein
MTIAYIVASELNLVEAELNTKVESEPLNRDFQELTVTD